MPVSLLETLARTASQKVMRHVAVKPLREARPYIQQWLASPFGQQLLAAEQQTLDQIMPKIFGYHLMQLSVLNNVSLCAKSPVTHHFPLGIHTSDNTPAVASFEQLPVEAESIDAALLHHVLEYSTHPHQLLRETARTIIPNGYIVIVGFNPVAALGIKKNLQRLFTHKPHWRYHGLGYRRLEDWLRLLDFEPVFFQYGFHTAAFARSFQTRFTPCCGSFFVIAARKGIVPLTPVKNPWHRIAAFPKWVRGSAVPRKPMPGKPMPGKPIAGYGRVATAKTGVKHNENC